MPPTHTRLSIREPHHLASEANSSSTGQKTNPINPDYDYIQRMSIVREKFHEEDNQSSSQWEDSRKSPLDSHTFSDIAIDTADFHHSSQAKDDQFGEGQEVNPAKTKPYNENEQQSNLRGILDATHSHSQTKQYNPRVLAREFDPTPGVLSDCSDEDDDDEECSIDIDDIDDIDDIWMDDIWMDDETLSPIISGSTKRHKRDDSLLDFLGIAFRARSSMSSQISYDISSHCTDQGEDHETAPAKKRRRINKDKGINSVDTTQCKADLLERLKCVMVKSKKSQASLQEWDRKNGLPASHCQTMVNSARSREQLQSGMVLQKWNGVPLLMLPGARVKVVRRRFRGVKVAHIE